MAATRSAAGLLYRPAPRTFQVIGTDQYYTCNDALYPPADAFKSFFAWKAKYAPYKPVLVGEIGERRREVAATSQLAYQEFVGVYRALVFVLDFVQHVPQLGLRHANGS